LIPNTGAFITSWDTTNCGFSGGIFAEGFSDSSFSASDWHAASNQLLKLVAAGKIVMLQDYLANAGDLAKRCYLLANDLLVKGARSYLFYFANSTLEWYPEWNLDSGLPPGSLSSSSVTSLVVPAHGAEIVFR
jgi:hypothetical protein